MWPPASLARNAKRAIPSPSRNHSSVIEITHIVIYGYRITAIFDLMWNMFHYKEDFQMPDTLCLFAVLTDTQSMMRFS
jgi:hypothetical protein